MDLADIQTLQSQLNSHANMLENLSKMPERTGPNDLLYGVKLLRKASEALVGLYKQQPPGCVCRTIEDDNYSRFIPDPKCRHHGYVAEQERRIKKSYDEATQKLKEPYRVQLIAAALEALGPFSHTNIDEKTDLAMKVADAVIEKLVTKEPTDAR